MSARSAYRQLLRVQRQLFVGDLSARTAARAETRTRFMENAAASPEQAATLVAEADEAAEFIRQNIAQTVLNERGNFELQPRPDQIHEGDEPPPFQPNDKLNN